jgi:peptidoglycan/LPS O-acetylase OafA/YrhL
MIITKESSYILNILRVFAAQAVLVGHSLSMFGLSKTFGYMASVGVIVFFLLSGYLITHSAHNIQKWGGDSPSSSLKDSAAYSARSSHVCL